MEILNITLGANGFQQYRKAGSYFEILASTGQIGVNFYSTQGGQTDSIKGGVSGLFMVTDYGAFDVQDLSGATNAVQILVCDEGENGGSRRQPGTVDVMNKVGSNVQLLSSGLASTIGFQVGVTALTPAANLRGARMRNAYATATGGTGNAQTIVIAAPVTPVSVAPAQAIWLSNAFTPNATPANDSHLEMNVTIPPGWGIYLCTNHGGATGATAAATVAFELL